MPNFLVEKYVVTLWEKWDPQKIIIDIAELSNQRQNITINEKAISYCIILILEFINHVPELIGNFTFCPVNDSVLELLLIKRPVLLS